HLPLDERQDSSTEVEHGVHAGPRIHLVHADQGTFPHLRHISRVGPINERFDRLVGLWYHP
ncbi:MAG: hypothetical protein KAS94_14990, partial [Desulfobulbaceae bacterium]|nr:hypothetical protein [Desulfobulbaceae bacterium]